MQPTFQAPVFRIHCDESWSGSEPKVKCEYFVFHGLLVREECETEIVNEILKFKKLRGLCDDKGWVEIKWSKAEEEAKAAERSGRKNRYEECLDIVFNLLKKNMLHFGCMYLKKRDYDRVRKSYCKERSARMQDYFFMLYFYFLHHSLIKQIKGKRRFELFIDDRDMGVPIEQYDIDRLRQRLNSQIYLDIAPKSQMPLSRALRRRLSNVIESSTLVNSKEDTLVQLSDLWAGCIRCILENEFPPPSLPEQSSLDIPNAQGPLSDGQSSGKKELALYFYRKLKSLKDYEEINLLNPSFHHRVNVFPFKFEPQRDEELEDGIYQSIGSNTRPLWKIRTGRFAGWRAENELYDSQGKNVGYFDGDFAFSSKGDYLGQMFNEYMISRRLHVAWPIKEARERSEDIAETPCDKRLGIEIEDWEDPRF